MAPLHKGCDRKPSRTPLGVSMVYANDDLYCSYCPKVFSSRNSKKRHEMNHNGIRPFSCKRCKVSFTLLKLLTNHESTCRTIDSLDKNIKWCSFCDRFFKNEELLQCHYYKCHDIFYNSENPRVFKAVKGPKAEEDGSNRCESSGAGFKSPFSQYEIHEIVNNEPIEKAESSEDNNQAGCLNLKTGEYSSKSVDSEVDGAGVDLLQELSEYLKFDHYDFDADELLREFQC